MAAPAVEGIDLFKIADRSISGRIPSFKTGAVSHVRQPFYSQLEERLMLWLEYNPQVAHLGQGVFWIGTEKTLTKFRHHPQLGLFARQTGELSSLC